MAGEWREIRLKDVATLITKGTTPTTLGMPFTATGINYIKAESVTDEGTIDRNKFAFIDPSTHAALRRSQIEAGDLLMSMAGVYLGKVAVVPPDVVPANTNQAVAIIRLSSNVDQHFVAYYLRNPEFNIYLNSLVAQSAQPNLNLAEIGNLPVRLPTPHEQRAIAHILGTLDDKIELNRRMNETLEAMARALFKSWFVDFDPVRAKVEGRDTGLPKNIADMFPNSFEDSELGEVPRGWRGATLADIATLNPESWSKETRPSQVNYIDLSNTKLGRIEAVTVYAASDAPSRAQRILRPGDTIVGTVRPGNGSYAFISMAGLTGSTGFAVLRPHSAHYEEFVYLSATATDNIDALQHLADGGAYPAVRPEIVSATSIVHATDRVLDQFSLTTRPLLARIGDNEQESRTLAGLRDALLPKLISGRVRVAPRADGRNHE